MKIIDLTHLLKTKTPKYPEDPKTKINTKNPKNTNYNISQITIGTHTGTHIDSPKHYIPNTNTINQIKLENLIGKTNILKTNQNNKEIKEKHINLPEKTEKIILIKTNWHKNWQKENYFTNHPYPSHQLIKKLIKKEIKGIAIDGPSIDHPKKDKNHKILLKNNIWIAENLTNTDQLTKNIYTIHFIPLKIETEAIQIRAFAIEK